LKYFVDISGGVMLRAAPLSSLWLPMLMLAVLGAAAFTVSLIRFRRDLAPTITSSPVPSDPATPAPSAPS
jgi:ABC-2 type transport system permease protein